MNNVVITPMVKNLLIINVVVFICTGIILPQFFNPLALHFPLHPEFEVWQLLTHMFMHADMGHIFFNMFGLYIFGPLIENRWGSKRFLFFWITCGLGGVMMTYGFDYVSYLSAKELLTTEGYTAEVINDVLFRPNILTEVYRRMVGASGCLFGVSAAVAYLYPNMRMFLLFIPFPVKVKYLVGGYLVYETLAAFGVISGGQNIGHAAHVGGAVIGFLLTWYWKNNDMDVYRIY